MPKKTTTGDRTSIPRLRGGRDAARPSHRDAGARPRKRSGPIMPTGPDDGAEAAARRCLSCGQTFASAHRGHRICGPCKTRRTEEGVLVDGDYTLDLP